MNTTTIFFIAVLVVVVLIYFPKKKADPKVCPKCKGTNITYQVVTDITTKRRGCLGWLLWILLAICTLGLILIIPLITNSKTKSGQHTEAICQSCGHRWII